MISYINSNQWKFSCLDFSIKVELKVKVLIEREKYMHFIMIKVLMYQGYMIVLNLYLN